MQTDRVDRAVPWVRVAEDQVASGAADDVVVIVVEHRHAACSRPPEPVSVATRELKLADDPHTAMMASSAARLLSWIV